MLPGDQGLDFEGDLNDAQLQAVRNLEGPHLVIAGAGSGKTRTLVYRVANLVEQGVAPESILLLTFTRRAAKEMLRRASSLLDERCNRVAGGTFHSFANIVLRRWAELLGYSKDFTILDRADAGALVGSLRSEHGHDRRERRFPRKDTLADLFSKQINTHRSLEQLLEEDYPQFLDDLDAISEIQEQYRARKKEQNVMDYDDLLVNLRDLLANHPDQRNRLSSTYRYVMVDEYQDTNRLQAHIGALLASAHGNMMVVGDDAQSIYSFRGADFRNIMDFPKIFSDCQVTVLEENYRSTQPILDLSNEILRASTEKYSKELTTQIEGNAKPVYVRTADDHDQAAFICDAILELREEGAPLEEIAVLSRAAWHTNSLEVELRRRNIPFRKFGGIKFVEAAHVKDVCALLRISLNPLDVSSWLRVLQLLPGIGPRRAQQMTELVVRSAGDPETAFSTQFRAARYGPGLRKLSDALRDISRGSEAAVGERIKGALAYYKPLMSNNYDDATRRAQDLEALLVIAERYQTLERFLTDIAIEPPEFGRGLEDRDRDDEWITLSTIHSAKGLEWESVFVINLVNGHFPVMSATLEPDAFEEERRLLYVAVTRCKENLFLLKPEVVASRAWMSGVGETSPLIREIKGFDSLTESRSYRPSRDHDSFGGGITSPGASRDRLSRIEDYFDDER